MNKKTGQATSKALMALFLLLCSISVSAKMEVHASDGQEYITISVDATDENGNLLYALDTDEEGAFTSSNEFSVPAGTSHTIYVKDAAGNISSQEFNSSEEYEYVYGQNVETDDRTVNIDVTLNNPSGSPEPEYGYGYSTSASDPAEPGQGTIYERVTTDAADQSAERIFYTITTEEGEVFYMVIDQGQSSNNVYLLDMVKLSDLKSLAVDDSGGAQTESSSSLLGALSSSEQSSGNEALIENTDTSAASDKGSRMTRNLIILLIIAAVGGGYYYYKNIYKNKKDEQMDLIDALDKNDFLAEDEENDEADFGLDEDYQEQLMKQLMDDDDGEDIDISEGNSDEGGDTEESVQEDSAAFYATSHKEDADENEYEDEDEDGLDEEEEDDE